jgi:hypothetical protein
MALTPIAEKLAAWQIAESVFNPDLDTMPAEPRKANQRLDKAVDASYGYQGHKDDAARGAILFGLYQQLSGAIAPAATQGRQKLRKAGHSTA